MISHDFSEDQFNKKACELIEVSEILNDNWKINEKHEKIYLSKKQTISRKSQQLPPADDDDPSVVHHLVQDDIIAIEYHVLFHPSYQVPVLYFTAFSDNSIISLDSIEDIFVDDYEPRKGHDDVKNIITQAEHPILFKPFFMLHPCKVNEILSQFPDSKNFILTFLSLFGPSVQLRMNPEYETFIDSKT